MWIGLRRDAFNFRYGNHGQKPHEKQEQGQEQTKGSDQGPDVHPGGFEIRPVRRQVISVERGDNDDKALEPHANVDRDRKQKDVQHVRPDFLEPETMR